MLRLVRAPALHFLLIGAVLLALSRWHDGRVGQAPPRPRITLTADDVARLREQWNQEHGSPPGPAAEASLVADAVDEEVLHRQALALGLDRRDPMVRERLIRLGAFLSEEPAHDQALEGEARRLGLDRSDIVIRRHLVQMMRLAAGRLGPSDLPTEAELQTYLVGHPEAFAQPARVRLVHVYLSRDRHGAALEADAKRLLDELRRAPAGPEAAAARGDAFIRGAEIGPASEVDLARIFGAEFARAVEDAVPHTWVGPVASAYGLHLVWVSERVAAAVPPLAAVRTQVLHRLLAERSEERRYTRLQTLRARYEIGVTRTRD